MLCNIKEVKDARTQLGDGAALRSLLYTRHAYATIVT